MNSKDVLVRCAFESFEVSLGHYTIRDIFFSTELLNLIQQPCLIFLSMLDRQSKSPFVSDVTSYHAMSFTPVEKLFRLQIPTQTLMHASQMSNKTAGAIDLQGTIQQFMMVLQWKCISIARFLVSMWRAINMQKWTCMHMISNLLACIW